MSAVQDSIDCVKVAALAADAIKAEHIVAFDVTKPLAITDIFMIAVGNNDRQVLAIAEEIEKQLHIQKQRDARSREGLQEAQWILLDYGDFVIHVMNREAHEYYDLERLWRDCPAIELDLPEHTADVEDEESASPNVNSLHPSREN
ncbi:ribosome silencing factor [Bifidobacterium aquikefiri]|mgnify:CR=1 FL=1|uniref:ribosome silencing factor n=1 Tax=Bifidobacterium aquikefiri TaxID=1653207 RepID=UPI0023F4E2DC|nr:ribosome silencing factor [Bifidobacterium aquikefiri]